MRLIHDRSRKIKNCQRRSVYRTLGILKSPLIDAGTGEVIDAADEAVLPQPGQAEVLLRLDIVACPVEGLVERTLSRNREGGEPELGQSEVNITVWPHWG